MSLTREYIIYECYSILVYVGVHAQAAGRPLHLSRIHVIGENVAAQNVLLGLSTSTLER